MASVEIAWLDICDPIKDEVKSHDEHDIACWMLDGNYDNSNFVVSQIVLCDGDCDEFEEWKKGPSDVAAAAEKQKAEQTLKLQLDDDALARVYGHQSYPFPAKKGQNSALRVLSQFGEETIWILTA